MMTFDQGYEDNKREFIARLVLAGWTESDALVEWNRIQGEVEGEL